jgi:hypothetical protein
MRIAHHKSSKPFKRKLVFEGKTWSWRIARANVWIRSPKGDVTLHTDAFELNGTTLDEWVSKEPHPASIDIPYCPCVTPSLIRDTIEKQISLS